MSSPLQSFEGPARATASAPADAGICPPGSRFPLLPGVRSRTVRTSRLLQHLYESGPEDGEPLVLIHGNASSARFFEDLMAAMPEWRIIAPDMRGYGASEVRRVDATRGVRDYADDIHALIETLGIPRFHLLGWSLGGVIVMQYVIDHPERVQSLTLHASGSPYGYGCTHGADGQPNCDDFAGSGGGLINPQVRAAYAAKDFTADSPFTARSTLRQHIVKPPFLLPPEREDVLVEQMLLMAIGDEYYPGDGVPSPNWPFKAPGRYGPNNALSPKYLNLSGLADVRDGPSVLWVRGADDALVSDAAMADPGALGKLGLIPGWPGEEVYPPQPMLAQLRAVLDRYAANGGRYREEVLADCGHSPLLERPAEFQALFRAFLREHGLRSASAATPAPVASATVAPAMSAPAMSAPDGPDTAPAAPRRRGLLDILFRRG